jgi:adenosylcobyric acid synthase
MNARALMVLGTASHAGKSILAAGLGRILSDDGYRVAPFKAQNMSLNSAATPDGGEIGRAQALQAEACRIPASVEMNPVLIKPSSDTGSQIVLLGRVWGQVTAADYHKRRVEDLFPTVLESYRKLASQYDVVVLEGAGSPAEVNLKEHDIVNMRMAQAAGAACLLVGDIDRGGVFASLLGTLELLDPWERGLIRGFVINKFRGDGTLLRPGVEMMEQRLRIPCVGVVPYLHNLGLDEEDGVALEERPSAARAWGRKDARLRVGVIALPHMSNFTDFDALSAEPSVALAYLDDAGDFADADLVILPGSKQTMDDLEWLYRRGLVQPLREHHARKRGIIGICGGFQMLGTRIEDPHGIENNGHPRSRMGFGLLPVTTVLHTVKTTRPVSARVCADAFCGQAWDKRTFHGYEIHVGETCAAADLTPFAEITTCDGGASSPDGAVSSDGLVFGTYVHGIFDDDAFRHAFLDAARAARGLAPAGTKAFVTTERDARLDRLASHLRGSLNLDLIRSWIG